MTPVWMLQRSSQSRSFRLVSVFFLVHIQNQNQRRFESGVAFHFLLAPSVIRVSAPVQLTVIHRGQRLQQLPANSELTTSCLCPQRCLGDALRDSRPLRTPHLCVQLSRLRTERQRKDIFITPLPPLPPPILSFGPATGCWRFRSVF